jgi:hypothetical protein
MRIDYVMPLDIEYAAASAQTKEQRNRKHLQLALSFTFGYLIRKIALMAQDDRVLGWRNVRIYAPPLFLLPSHTRSNWAMYINTV